jgi:hypothetical protein
MRHAARNPYIREKFTREHGEAHRIVFLEYPKDRYETEVESWRHLQSRICEFTMKRLRDVLMTLREAIAYLAKTVPRTDQTRPKILSPGVSGAYGNATGDPPAEAEAGQVKRS